ncbi:MAG: site-specific DNA-methyltransferase [Planctomycetota bacterium]
MTSKDLVPEKLDLRSLDVAAEKRAELLRLFPEVHTEGGKVDFERLKAALGEQIDPATKERYGLTWPGKAACFQAIQRPSLATLRPKPEQSIEFDTTQNLIIEGDNLEALKLLQKSYLGKVKMIYIDPPYNTGNDFIYPDNYTESLQTYLEYTGQVDAEGRRFSTNTEADGRFHSKWLNMMYPRLYLARNLLREDGVIFISIDDHEVSRLTSVCDDVFGEEHRIGCFIWQHSVQPKGYAGTVSVHHNYLLAYRRSESFELASLVRTEEHNKNYSNPDNDPRGAWRPGDVRNALDRPNLKYDIRTPSGRIIHPPENGWRWSQETIAQKIKSGEIKFSRAEDRIIRKIYLDGVEGRVPESMWFAKETGTTRDAASELKELFGGETPFDTAKPVALLQRMLEVGAVEADDVVLDFFAGSGTTAHAVIEQNKKDGGNRKFILVQLPEPTNRTDYPTIAEITKERVRRVIKNMNDAEKGQLRSTNEPKPDRGFRVFQLATSNFKPWDGEQAKDGKALQKQLQDYLEHVLPDRSEQDLLYEILLKDGFPLTTPIATLDLHGFRVHSIAGGQMLVCLQDKLTHDLIQTLAAKKPSRIVCLDRGFHGNDQLKANAAKLFATAGVDKFKTV